MNRWLATFKYDLDPVEKGISVFLIFFLTMLIAQLIRWAL